MKSTVKMKSFFKEYYKERFKISNESFNFYEKLNMKKKVILYGNDLWLPKNNIQFYKINKNTCFDIMESSNKKTKYINHNIIFEEHNGNPLIKSKEIILKLNEKQQFIIKKWIKAYALMYNETLKYIKEQYITKNNKLCLDWMKIRKILINKRNKIVEESGSTKSNQIKIHDIDYSIKLACQNYKTCIKLHKMKKIKHFRIRYWNSNKEKKILDLEKDNFKSGSIRKNVLGEVKGYYNGKEINFSEIKKDCRLVYKQNKYYLYIPEDVKIENEINKNKIISIDPGIRTFLTGITEHKVVEIGKNIKEKIEKYTYRKEEIKRKEIPKKIKSKIEKRCNKHINNIINETHWQSINYLTKNYSEVLIGNMSTKSIISNENNLSASVKKMAQIIKLYEFRQRLKYKCETRGVKYKCVDERYTSKMCSICGNIKEDLKENKIYKCEKCGKQMDRDVNGSRNIYLKSIE